MAEIDCEQEWPILAEPVRPTAPLPFFQYVRTVRENALAGFHDDLYRQRIAETKFWRLRTFIVNDPAGIRHVLVDNAANYIKGNIEHRISRWPEKGFAAEDGKKWRQRRQTMSSSFDHRTMPGNLSVVVEAAQEVLERWSALPPGEVIEVSAEMSRMALEVISRIVFSSDSAEFVGIMERASMRYQEERIFDPFDFAPVLGRLWGFYKGRKRGRIFKELNNAIDGLMAKRVRERRYAENDFLGRLMATKDPQAGRGLSVDEVHSQVTTLLGTGYDTVSSALMWTWYLLAEHPPQEARLHRELEQVLAGRTPAPEDLAKLPYTRMVIAEALRLYPPVHTMAWRGALEDDEICGVRIPKGATVTIIPWVLHRHAELWDAPQRFDPERFSPDRSRGRSPFAYLPFGIGPRVCIGASFVMTEVMLMLAALAQRYRLRLAPGQKIEPQGFVQLKARYGLKATLESWG